MVNGIVIIGCGGFAKEVHGLLMSTLKWETDDNSFLGFLDDNTEWHHQQFQGYPVLGGIDWLAENREVKIVLAIGSPIAKKSIVENIKKLGDYTYLSLIDPSVITGADVKIGKGAIICAGSILTTNIAIGDFATINLACTVGHDSEVGKYSIISPGVNVSGNCVIEEGVDFGTGSTIIQGKKVGHWSIIGAGSVVVRDVPSNTTSVGSPSKVIKERPEGWHIE